ncbi:flagellar basal-body MS-ring/collar protein FliF [Desulfallas thermosapovorans]|uniref:Flagellar M-ring protein n=1 Tax=Desulfallas thermosapovorans DSM 6562 TaxID=1121431 RepID=A0A5S4ZRF5_9FIRM|nr:flagellar basal-body MS-ring/collar protein FliF [Desulfallas thermosapovorans]TYO95487.1 flagellar M-ring protein FliF [Desulfallas thermosapovorans DSM 6562]
MNSGLILKIRQWWQGLGRQQKIMFTAGCAVILVTVAVLGSLLLRPNYAPLFSELEPQDAARIMEELDSTQTPYRLTNNGKTIEVPAEQVYKLRIQMASAGALYNNGAGFELFDESKFGITEFEQHVGYQRALQEELRRTIVQLSEVEQARVHLVLPRESVFLDSEVIPSASIALKLKPYTRLEPNQVQGIQSLVMGSVQGLVPENIHIIDDQGNVLNAGLSDGEELSATVALKNFELRRKFEQETETRLQQMLNRILGPGKAVAMVSAELDFDHQETVRTEYGPGAVLSEQRVNEEGAGGAAAGVPGDNELPGEQLPVADLGNESNYNREQTTTNYQVDTTQQTLVKAPGAIRRLSVSVTVDGEYTEENLNSLQQTLAAAVGYDAARGDQITVTSASFHEDVLPGFDEPAALAPALDQRDLIIAAGIALALLAILLAVILLLRRRARLREEALAEQEAEELARLQAAATAEEQEQLIIEEPKPGYRTRIREIAKERPGDVTEIIKVWLKE